MSSAKFSVSSPGEVGLSSVSSIRSLSSSLSLLVLEGVAAIVTPAFLPLLGLVMLTASIDLPHSGQFNSS